MASREANLIGYLSPEKGNLWRLLYETMHTLIQKYWKYAHNYAVQCSHTNNEYYSWDKFVEELEALDIGDVNWPPPVDFDPRFYYYSSNVNLVEPLSTDEGRRTTEEAEIAKTGPYGMSEFPTLEMKLIPDESELERGKKRGLEGAILPPPHKGRKGNIRGSSVTSQVLRLHWLDSDPKRKERVPLKELLKERVRQLKKGLWESY